MSFSIIITLAASTFSLAMLLWVARISYGTRIVRDRLLNELDKASADLAGAKALIQASPGVILVWDGVALNDGWPEISQPRLSGSTQALAGMLSITDAALSTDPAIRIVEGLADLEARTNAGRETSLRDCLKTISKLGHSFSISVMHPDGRFIEVDGHAVGTQIAVWINDKTLKGMEESSARGRLEEVRQTINKDPAVFHEILSKLPCPVWAVNGAGKIKWANAEYLTSVQISDVDALLDAQKFLDNCEGQIVATLKSGVAAQSERLVPIGGEPRTIKLLTFPVSSGAVAIGIDATDDINELKKLNRHLDAHANTLNHVADGIVMFSNERECTYFNAAFARMWGLAESEFNGLTHRKLLDRLYRERKLPELNEYAEWRAEQLSHYQNAEEGEDIWSLPDNRTLEVIRQPHPDGGLLYVFRDITEEIQRKMQYKTLIDTQASTLDNLHEAVAVFHTSGRLKLSNRAFRDMWGLSETFLDENEDFDAIVDAIQPLPSMLNKWTAIKGHISDFSDSARQPAEGHMEHIGNKFLTYITQPLPDGNTLIAFADVSSARRMEAALRDRADAMEAADRLKTEFVRNVSRKLREPLQTVQGYAEMLDEELSGVLNPIQHEQIGSILQATDKLNTLTTNILELAMLEGGHLQLELEAVDLQNVVQESVSLAVSQASDAEINVSVNISDGIQSIMADRKRIGQVLFNLMSNALAYTDSGGSIVVSAEKVGESVKLSVSDSGCGIAIDKRAEAFNSFSHDDRRENAGAGLGLALVKNFMALHDGTVTLADSESGGTEVTCWWPIQPKGQGNTGAMAA